MANLVPPSVNTWRNVLFVNVVHLVYALMSLYSMTLQLTSNHFNWARHHESLENIALSQLILLYPKLGHLSAVREIILANKELLLQLDHVPYLRCPPRCPGPATTTDTRDLVSTAQSCHISNAGREHGLLWLIVSIFTWDLGEALPDVIVEDLPGRGLRQMFPNRPAQ